METIFDITKLKVGQIWIDEGSSIKLDYPLMYNRAAYIIEPLPTNSGDVIYFEWFDKYCKEEWKQSEFIENFRKATEQEVNELIIQEIIE